MAKTGQSPTRYFGKVCSKHPELKGERNGSRNCVGCAKTWADARYLRDAERIKKEASAHYAANKDRIKAQRKLARAAKSALLADERAAKKQQRHEIAVENAKKYHEKYIPVWRAKNADKLREQGAVRMKAWRDVNTTKVKQKANSPEMQAYRALRRAKTRNATPGWANAFFIREAYALAKLREKVCGGKWHVDHIVPLKSKLVCGLHCESNLQVIPAKANVSKGNRHWPEMP